jgi:hypothetical protein
MRGCCLCKNQMKEESLISREGVRFGFFLIKEEGPSKRRVFLKIY